MKLPSNDKVADHLFKLYQRYAHDIPMIHSFRTWILTNSNLAKNGFSSKSINNTLKDITVTSVIKFCKEIREIPIEKILKMREIPKETQHYLERIKILINSL